jgi:hypothetical protein
LAFDVEFHDGATSTTLVFGFVTASVSELVTSDIPITSFGVFWLSVCPMAETVETSKQVIAKVGTQRLLIIFNSNPPRKDHVLPELLMNKIAPVSCRQTSNTELPFHYR